MVLENYERKSSAVLYNSMFNMIFKYSKYINIMLDNNVNNNMVSVIKRHRLECISS